MRSAAETLAAQGPEAVAAFMAQLSPIDRIRLRYKWAWWARKNQLVPGKLPNGQEWLTWLILAGRGFGKTRCGAEWVRSIACGPTPLAKGTHSRIALVAETAADARDVLVEGESGILAVHPKDMRPTYEVSKRRLTWPNGAVATLYNGTEPDQLRGPQHDAAWVDELAKYRYAQETWDMLQFGLRLGVQPRQCVTTTPRPIPLIKELVNSPTTYVTRGKTSDNKPNLASTFLKTVVGKYEGTRLGRQELDGDILDDLPGALWSYDSFQRTFEYPEMERIVVAVDPSGTKGVSKISKAKGALKEAGDDIGIVVCGKGVDGRGYVLADGTCNLGPDGWGRRAIEYYYGAWSPTPEDHEADCIVAETNFGGAMVESVIKSIDDMVSYKEVRASRGKFARAEPVAALYTQGRIVHVGRFDALEEQMVLMAPDGYSGEGSPDRLDALVWALTELFLSDRQDAMMLLRARG